METQSLIPTVTLPFKRFVGKPVTEMLADQGYIDWCNKQPHLKEKMTIIINQYITNNSQASATPAHNKLQNQFLDKTLQKRLLWKICPSIPKMFQKLDELYKLPEYKQVFGEFKMEIEYSNWKFHVEWKYNWDVALFVELDSDGMSFPYNLECQDIELKKTIATKFKSIKNINISNYCNSISISINVTRKILCELKPSLGDDYPDVLRKMRKQIEATESYFLSNDKNCDSQERHKASGIHYGIYTLIIGGEFNAESATKEQLIEIFKTAKIQVIFMSDLLDVNLEKTICDEVKPKEPSNKELLQENYLLKEQLQIAQDKIKGLEGKLLKHQTVFDHTSSENNMKPFNPLDIRSFFGGSKPK
jgi:hypothetical protein